jgi:hypothetical protein
MDANLDRHVQLAERRIVRGEGIVTRQLMLIDRLRLARRPTIEAERTLGILEGTLREFYRNRETLLALI